MRCLALALACAPGLALADPPSAVGDAGAAGARLSFGWNAPEGCPVHGAILARTEQMLGRSAESSLSEPLAVDATVTRVAEQAWELRLMSGDASEPRRVSAATCEELGEMAALFVALSIDPTLPLPSVAAFADLSKAPKEGSGPAAAESASTPQPPLGKPNSESTKPAAERDGSRPPSDPSAARAASPVRALAGVSAALGLGRLPGVAWGARVQGGVAIEPLKLRAGLEYFPERYASVTPTTGGYLSLGAVGLQVGYALGVGPLAVEPSAGVTFGWLHGEGDGVANPASGDALLVGVEPGLRASHALSTNWALFTDAALTLGVNRPRFVLDEIGEVHRPAPVAARIGLGAEWSGP